LDLQTVSATELEYNDYDSQKLESRIVELEAEAHLQKQCLQQFQSVMAEYDDFVNQFLEKDDEEENSERLVEPELGAGGDTENDLITLELLEREKLKTLELQAKFNKLCLLEDECLSQFSSQEIKDNLHEKLERVREIQRVEKEEFSKFQNEIKSHLGIKSKLEALNRLEEDVQNMDKDVQEVASILMEEIHTSFPDMDWKTASNDTCDLSSSESNGKEMSWKDIIRLSPLAVPGIENA
jgi:hypothetical protein